MATVRYFAAAADAAKLTTEEVAATTVGELLETLREGKSERFAQVLSRCSLLVDGTRTTDHGVELRAGSVVDVLPPFAGG